MGLQDSSKVTRNQEQVFRPRLTNSEHSETLDEKLHCYVTTPPNVTSNG